MDLNLAHLHLLLNHFPIIGTIVGFALFIVALLRKQDDLLRASLGTFVVIALLVIPTFVSGAGAADLLKDTQGIPQDIIKLHEGAAMVAMLLMMITGAFSIVALWQFRFGKRPSAWVIPTVFLFGVITLGMMARTGNLGGEIRHPEILPAGQTAMAAENASAISRLAHVFEPDPDKFTDFMVAGKWRWAFIMDLHFFGLVLLIGSLAVLNLRILGFAKQLPLAPLHNLLPWAILGLGINIVTGMLAFIGMPAYYAFDLALWLKILALLLAAGDLLLFYVTDAFDECLEVGPGQSAPALAKFIAGSSMLLWVSVIVLGRYIQLLQDTINH